MCAASLPRVTGGQALANLINNLARERRWIMVLFGVPWLRSLAAQPSLQGIPSLRINDGGVLAIKDLSLMANATGIDRVCQDMVWLAARHDLAAPEIAIRSTPQFGAKSQSSGSLLNQAHGAPLFIEAIEREDCLCFGVVDTQGAAIGIVSGPMFEPPVFPVGPSPIAVFMAAPMIRRLRLKNSRVSRCRTAQTSMCQWTRTCSPVETRDKTCARSSFRKFAAKSAPLPAAASSSART